MLILSDILFDKFVTFLRVFISFLLSRKIAIQPNLFYCPNLLLIQWQCKEMPKQTQKKVLKNAHISESFHININININIYIYTFTHICV
jgi:hypothetical protein